MVLSIDDAPAEAINGFGPAAGPSILESAQWL